MSRSSNESLMAALDEYVFGHADAKKALITMLNRSKLRWYQKYMKEMYEENLINPLKILLIASSGTGKTHLIESLRNVVHFPLVRVDATQMNPAGSSGGVKVSDLKKLITEEATNCCLDYPNLYYSVEGAIDQTVVFVDEIDKLGTPFESSGNWNKHVQSNFLTMFDNKTEFSGVSFVFAGSFSDITNKKSVQKSFGFLNDNTTDDDGEILDEKILNSGLIPELLGRINCIVELDVFTEEDLLRILKERVVPKKLVDLAAYGLFNVDVPEEKLKEMVLLCLKSGQGVRHLQRQVDKYCLELEYDAGVEGMLYNTYWESD